MPRYKTSLSTPWRGWALLLLIKSMCLSKHQKLIIVNEKPETHIINSICKIWTLSVFFFFLRCIFTCYVTSLMKILLCWFTGVQTGEICLDILKNAWSPAWTLQSVCRAIIALMAHPEPDSPLNCDSGNLSWIHFYFVIYSYY